MITTAMLVAAAASCPAARPVTGAPGTPEAVHTPPPAAMSLNNEGKAFYRQARWREAATKYRAALAADPEFVGAALNLACVHAREERFAEAAREAAALVHRAYVPAAREVMAAADLASLHVRPEMATLSSAIADAAQRWGASLRGALLFVGRTAPPVRIGADGTFVLALNQEVFAWIPRSGRYRRVTADDGRVLAFVRSADGRQIAYARAGRLVRRQGRGIALRALSVRTIDLPVMSVGPVQEIPGDVAELTLSSPGGARVIVTVRRPEGAVDTFHLTSQGLVPSPPHPSGASPRVTVGAGGVATGQAVWDEPACRFRARDAPPEDGGVPRIEIAPAAGRRFFLNARHGARLSGFSFP